MDRATRGGGLREGETDAAGGQGRPEESELDGRRYVAAVLDCYTGLPDTPGRARRNDRRLAERLHEQGIPLEVVRAAFLLATSRRWFRPADADRLEPIRSMRYFVPVIDELRRRPPDPIYIELLEERLRTGFPSLGVPGLPRPIPW